MFERVKSLLASSSRDAQLHERLSQLRHQMLAQVLWLRGRTQSAQASRIKYRTGADEAEIGQGFRPCTRYSRQYLFPSPEAPLMSFIDTRGIDEPGYDPAEDLTRFNAQAHILVVTV